ncbi:MAG: hypothetical protein P4L99_12155 [Chthoniobacter sp.]|nr:hypothetical protein [Chthoniobacter sp.]
MAIPGAGPIVHAVGRGVGHEADVLDLAIHGVLQDAVKPGAGFFDLGEVGEFRANRHGILMTAEIGQTQFFGVVGFEDDGHDGSFQFWFVWRHE